ncbi:hypothetical protein AtDm6_0184 [Acetobacter tropicalis]|uniref:Uncharacterized protein n=1 Tax=Acetobacter tropicalis TaxID=104102 RepID=A0A094ZWW6_9PROT|nr:hypothetical protein AtDm6_0184 [Acetobacter tropicalis]
MSSLTLRGYSPSFFQKSGNCSVSNMLASVKDTKSEIFIKMKTFYQKNSNLYCFP